LSHIASAFYTSPYKKCAFLTVDGVGEWATTSYGIACGKKGIQVLGELHFPDSLGLFYSSFTYYLGFKVNSGEYKMMGLAPYSNPKSDQVQKFKEIIIKHLIDIKPDGSIKLNMEFFEYPVGLRMVHPKKWEKIFGLKKRNPEEKLIQIHADLALAAQKVLEEILIKLISFIKKETEKQSSVDLESINTILKAEMICPGSFSKEESKMLQEIAVKAHQILDLRHYSRTDFIVTPRRGIYALETNALPGLTSDSLLPHSLQVHGVSYKEFLEHILGLL
jgi:hypothetical protein